MSKYCKSCGTQLPDSAGFCKTCGAEQEVLQTGETGEFVQVRGIIPDVAQDFASDGAAVKSDKSRVIIICVIAALLTAAIVVSFVLLKNNDGDTAEKALSNDDLSSALSDDFSDDVSEMAVDSVNSADTVDSVSHDDDSSEESLESKIDSSCADSSDISDESSETDSEADESSETEDSLGADVPDDSSDRNAFEKLEYIRSFTGYDASLVFADSEWCWGNFDGTGYPDTIVAFGADADVTGDGEYTVSITRSLITGTEENPNSNVKYSKKTGELLGASGCVIMRVDITGICDGTVDYKGNPINNSDYYGVNDKTAANDTDENVITENYSYLNDGDDANVNPQTKGAYTGQELNVRLVSIKADGKEVEFDESKIIYGNIETYTNIYSIEIYNSYGDTCNDPPIDIENLSFDNELSVTFKIEGLGEIPTFKKHL